MSFDLFGPATRCDIRLGYIDPNQGFVDGLTLNDANKYAKLNPGTTFIFRTRDRIRFLRINEVNKLTGDDLTPDSSADGSAGCQGITGLDIYDDDNNIKPEVFVERNPRVRFSGGGGIGAKGNPVFGDDGSLLAVDVIDGGWGYQYAPITEIFDPFGIGSGAVTRSIMIGDPQYPDCKFSKTFITYENEEDFEEPDLTICSPESSGGFGRRYNAEGVDVGPWDPTVYANFGDSPIKVELQRYQDFLLSLQGGQKINISDNIIRNWWTTRRFRPLRVISANKRSRVVHEVDYPAWSEFMNRNAVSPVPPSNVPGSDFAGIEYTMEWEENFPYDGTYIFRYLADNIGSLYLDNELLGSTKRFKGNPDKVKKIIKAGIHKIRFDLENIPIYEKVKTQLDKGGCPSLIDFKITTDAQFANGIKIPGLNIDFSKRFKGDQLNESFQREVALGREYDVEVTSPQSKNIRLRTRGESVLQLEELDDNDWQDLVCSVSCGRFIKINGNKCKLIFDAPPSQSNSSKSIEGSETAVVFDTISFQNKADRKLWRIDPTAGRDGDFINKYGILPFNPIGDVAKKEDKEGVHIIRWEYVDFPVSGNYTIETMVDDDVNIFIGNRSGGGRAHIGNGLRDINDGGDEVIIRKKGFLPGTSIGTGKDVQTRYFEAGKYRIRAELFQLRGSPIAGGNPMALAIRIKTTFREKSIISAKSWNENPMGIALSIDAPMPPVPQEPKPVQEGRCPNNPIWTTRFPGSSQTWYPVTHPAWSPFTNRFATSPVPPLGTPGSDNGGQVFRTTWVIEAPYEGFYGMKGTVDNSGRILIDDNEILRGGYFAGASFSGQRTLENFRSETPQVVKFPLSEGKHTITVEVENQKTDTFKTVKKKIFSTADWTAPTKVVRRNDEVEFRITSDASFKNGIELVGEFKYEKSFGKTQLNERVIKSLEVGKVYNVIFTSDPGTKKGEIRLRGAGQNVVQMEDFDDFDWSDIVCTASKGRFYDFQGGKSTGRCKYIIEGPSSVSGGTSSGTAKDGVTYEGPRITSYRKGFLSPVFSELFAPTEEIQGKTWVMKWHNVDFPKSGRYNIVAEVDDSVDIFIDGESIGRATLSKGNVGNIVNNIDFTATKGKRTVELRLNNLRFPNTSFQQNPTVLRLEITTPVDVSTGISKPWSDNPVGVSAVLIPPPCPKEIDGKGRVCRVVVDDPGNGYPKPPDGGTAASTYPATIKLDGVEIINPGINYNCGVDRLVMEPNNGVKLTYDCDTFGRIINVNVEPETPDGTYGAGPPDGGPASIIPPFGRGFTRQPEIRMITDTGINFQAVPRFVVERDPIDPDILPEQILQVTDLVGLKQTGFIFGRPYYGQVFYKEGVRYAGVYETPGQLIQVYDTLQESINAEVTTPPSAILRQGTDIRSNNPRLNIPGSPENLS